MLRGYFILYKMGTRKKYVTRIFQLVEGDNLGKPEQYLPYKKHTELSG